MGNLQLHKSTSFCQLFIYNTTRQSQEFFRVHERAFFPVNPSLIAHTFINILDDKSFRGSLYMQVHKFGFRRTSVCGERYLQRLLKSLEHLLNICSSVQHTKLLIFQTKKLLCSVMLNSLSCICTNCKRYVQFLTCERLFSAIGSFYFKGTYIYKFFVVQMEYPV